MPVPLTQECGDCIRQWLSGERWSSEVPLQGLPPSPPFITDASLTGWGTHLVDLTVAGVWSREKGLQINILEMKAFC